MYVEAFLKEGDLGGQTAAQDYTDKLLERFQIDIAVCKSSIAEAIQKKKELQKYDHISRNGINRFFGWVKRLWRTIRNILWLTILSWRKYSAVLFNWEYKSLTLKGDSQFAKCLVKELTAVVDSQPARCQTDLQMGQTTNSKG